MSSLVLEGAGRRGWERGSLALFTSRFAVTKDCVEFTIRGREHDAL